MNTQPLSSSHKPHQSPKEWPVSSHNGRGRVKHTTTTTTNPTGSGGSTLDETRDTIRTNPQPAEAPSDYPRGSLHIEPEDSVQTGYHRIE